VTDKPLDVIVPRARTEQGVAVVRLKEREAHALEVQLGEVRELAEGRPIAPSAEVIKLVPRGETGAFDVEVILPAREAHRGPAQVASERYRKNWDAIFSNPDKDLS
jgi:hypothetical protein